MEHRSLPVLSYGDGDLELEGHLATIRTEGYGQTVQLPVTEHSPSINQVAMRVPQTDEYFTRFSLLCSREDQERAVVGSGQKRGPITNRPLLGTSPPDYHRK
jgi:hypothetical protein